MARLAGSDITALLEFLKDLYSVCDLRVFRRQLVSRMHKLVGSELTSYNEVDFLGRRHTSVSDHPGASEFPDSHNIFDQHVAEHPLIGRFARSGDAGALKISDFLTKSQFRKLGLYEDFYRRVPVRQQMAFVLPARPPTVIGIALNRSGSLDFSERDRLLLNLVRPHVVQAYRSAKAITQMSRKLVMAFSALESLDSAVLLVSQSARMLATRRATQLLAKYFPGTAPTGAQLPDILRRWARHHMDNLKGTDVPSVLTPLTVKKGGNRLIVRLVPDADCFLLNLTEWPNATGQEAFLSFGLTPREAEVLSWVAQGKTNIVIGKILELSPRTVQKHVEHIFQKLRVETRTAAAAWALQIQGQVNSITGCATPRALREVAPSERWGLAPL